MTLTPELENLINMLNTEKTVCLLAPSFPVDFDYPDIVIQLKGIGFSKVVELTYAAKIINMQYHELIKSDPSKQWICTNCPTIVKYVKTKYPQHADKLIDIGSPMVIMSRFIKKEYGPDLKTVFVGPCLTKKIEAKESGDVDAAITFKELQQIFDYYKENNIPFKDFSFDVTESGDADFDKFYNDYTKVFPLTGAVADTLHYRDVLSPDQVLVVDELKNMPAAYMEKNPNIKFLDPLSCPGGCIGGPGVISTASTAEKIKKVKGYKEYCKKDKMGKKEGKFEYAEGLDFGNKII
ncbi:MAG: hypothetical protein NTX91_04440 [candidate division SR1 bacterium]|nr:hypothetical protein [candidate division SR1 bacterium]